MSLDWGREICGRPGAAESREWLVTNGIGGFASGTVSGLLSRRYHGLLVAALKPPLGRTLLVAKLDETLEYGGGARPLFANRWADGTVDPRGYRKMERFRLEGTTPVWTFAVADALLEKRVFMGTTRFSAPSSRSSRRSFGGTARGRGTASARIRPTACCARESPGSSSPGWMYGVGSIAEIFDGDPPFQPRGCIAQAWSVSETLQAWLETTGAAPARSRPDSGWSWPGPHRFHWRPGPPGPSRGPRA